ncbi:MAG: YaiI/YqxD family protein [SAR92 clade bacterium]|uniref:UPF0178 protein EVB02_01595 n=1 Tax=SAR92 clade bacterium TaxID=2315479 RepID=A0A520LMU6_9GAMM|nr:MAG: YaiI/YqxD family protein [SAR92 clade bacterium]
MKSNSNKILVDADACPNSIKKILFKASIRTGIELILVSNRPIQHPNISSIKNIVVEIVFDSADNKIIDIMKKQDMVITSDIPLAAEAIEKGGLALNPRGELYTLENIKSRLNMRDFMETMRSSGLQIQSNQATITNSEIKNFANHLDSYLSKH